MRVPIWLIVTSAVIATVIVIVVGQQIIQPDLPLLDRVESSLAVITPNADGDSDATAFVYRVNRDSLVSITLTDETSNVYTFRDSQPRPAGLYRVQFSGVVDGYVLPDEEIAGEVLRRLIPDGVYTWTIEAIAQDDGGEVASVSGDLTITEADSPLPEMIEFSVSPEVFTPNQDGISDRTQVNIYLTKDAHLEVYLINEDGDRIFMARREEGREEGEAGRQQYDYEGGVDIGADPPPDGIYTVVAIAQDDEGQQIRRTSVLEILNGGKPRAEISAQQIGATVVFEVLPYDESFFTDINNQGDFVPMPDSVEGLNLLPVSMVVGDMLVFRLTVENYGAAPIRTTGPLPGTVYDQTQVAASLGAFVSSGAWRVGIQCETSSETFPWRWAIGTPGVDLTIGIPNADSDTDTEVASDDEEFYYLSAGESSVVWGAIRMTEVLDAQNPQICWAGLIHEDVEITLVNNRVGAREILLEDPNAEFND